MLQIKTKQSYNIIVKNLSGNGPFVIHKKGNRSTIIANNKTVAVYQETISSEIKNNRNHAEDIMKFTRASVTRYITKHIKEGVQKIENKSPVVYSNKELWRNLLVGTKFYLIDASHCYWRIAYILGYIGKGLYKKYCDDTEFKVLRNIALSILTVGLKREYYENGEKQREIECDVSDYQQVYKNIRYYTYNNSGEVKDAITDYCIAYRVDGILLLPKGLKTAKEIFTKNKLLYKVMKCIKVDDKNYSTSDGEIKKIV
jgi:hypothetical protein